MQLQLLLSGGLVVTAAAIAVFFSRFWIRTRDPLFGFFSVAFFLLAAERICIVAFASELHYLIYLIRLGAFLMIAFAIVQKNRSRRRQAPTATPPKKSSLPPTVHRS